MGRKKDVHEHVADGVDDPGVREAPLVRISESDGELDENALEAPPKPRRQRSAAQIAAFERMRAANKKRSGAVPEPEPEPAPKPARKKPAPAPEPEPEPEPAPKPARKKPAPAPAPEPEPEPEPEPAPKSRKQRSDKGRPRKSAPIPIPVPHTRKVALGHNLYSNFIIV
jgi:outer membrane biosynthesis protein TonB